MGHGQETPRQKMIGLMYLFLTALMALNVSKDVLNSFVQVSDSLEQTIVNYKTKNEKIYDEFDKQYLLNQAKVGPWKEDAELVRDEASKVYDMLEGHKFGLLEYAEGPETLAIVDGKVQPSLLEAKDNIDKGAEYFIGGNEDNSKAREVRNSLNHYMEILLEVVPEKEENLRTSIEKTLETHDRKPTGKDDGHSWESYTFAHIPLIADFVAITTLQTNVKNTETDVINYLYSQISAGDFKVNAMAATVISNSNYIMKGNEYRAEVFLAAYDSTKAPEIKVGTYKTNDDGSFEMVGEFETLAVESGKGIFSATPRGIGDKKWGGLITVTSPDGAEKNYPFDVEYSVAEPNLVISPTKMNVFYYGIDNPVDISVPGIPADKIKPSIAGGGATIKKARSGYVIKPTKTSGKVNIRVSAEIDGVTKSMGSMPFRIKTIPEPKAKVLGKSRGTMSKAMITNAPGVVAELEDFVFDLKFRVTKFTVTTTVGGYTKEMVAKGNKFTPQQKGSIKNLKTGSKITIEDIEAVGPDGRAKQLSPVIFKIK